MKKYSLPLITLFVAGSLVANATVEKHGTTFDKEVNSSLALQNQGYTLPSSNIALLAPTSGGSAYANATVTKIQGLYFADGVGLKFNSSQNVELTYLYIGENITMKTSTGNVAGAINWSSTNQGSNGIFVMSNTTGAWVDINANYGNNISLSNMQSGSVYLNTLGSLNTSLGNSNKVYASLLSDLEKIRSNSTLYSFDETTKKVTRTLIFGNYSSWTGDVIISELNASQYEIIKGSDGLKIAYSIPEPSMFALLAGMGALALVGSRRRRK